MITVLILSTFAGLLFNYFVDIYNYIFVVNEKTIDSDDVQKLLYYDGWKKDTTPFDEYQFSKGTFVIHSNIYHYVLTNVVPTIHVIEKYSKEMTESEIKKAIEKVKQLNKI